MATISFALSILTSFIANVFVYYLDELVIPHDKLDFCESTRGYVRGVFRIFMVASLFYLWGLSRVGFAYYPDSPIAWCPFIIMIFASLCLLYGFIHVVAQQLKLQTNGAGSESWLRDPDEIVRNRYTYYFIFLITFDNIYGLYFVSKHGHRTGGDHFHEILHKQCTVIAGRSIFIAGLSQLCMIQYVTPDPTTDDYNSSTLAASYFFILFATLTTAFSFVSGFIASTIEVFLPDTEPGKQLAYAILIHSTVKHCYYAYVGSFLTLCLTIATMGYGLSFPVEYRYLSLGFGLTGLTTIVVGIVWLFRCSAIMLHDFAPPLSPQSSQLSDYLFQKSLTKVNNSGAMATISTGYVFTHVVTQLQNTLLSPVTDHSSQPLLMLFAVVHLAAVMLGLICTVYDSLLTIFSNHFINPYQRFKFATSCGWLFTISFRCYDLSLFCWLATFALAGLLQFIGELNAWITVTYGVIALVVTVFGAGYLEYTFQRFTGTASQEDSSKNITHINDQLDDDDNDLGNAVEFLGDVIGSVGSPRTQPKSPVFSGEPCSSGTSESRWESKAPNDADETNSQAGNSATVSAKERVEEDAHHALSSQLKRQEILNIAAAGVLFLGGFCYDAVSSTTAVANNLDSSDHPALDLFYVHTMCLGCIAAMVILYWTNEYNNKMAYFHESKQRLAFADHCYLFFLLTAVIGFIALMSILVGFPFISQWKFTSPSDHTPVIMVWLICGLGAMVTTTCCVFIVKAFWIIKSQETLLPSCDQIEVHRNPKRHQQIVIEHIQFVSMENQMTATNATSCFIAGSLCQEILNANVIQEDPYTFVTLYYYGVCTTTFALSMATIIISTLIRFLSGDLSHVSSRSLFAQRIYAAKHFIFGLNLMSLFCWLAALTVLGNVKYGSDKGKLWVLSLVIGLQVIMIACKCFLDVKKKSQYFNSMKGDGGGGLLRTSFSIKAVFLRHISLRASLASIRSSFKRSRSVYSSGPGSVSDRDEEWEITSAHAISGENWCPSPMVDDHSSIHRQWSPSDRNHPTTVFTVLKAPVKLDKLVETITADTAADVDSE